MEFLEPPKPAGAGFDPSALISTQALIAYGLFAALVVGLITVYFLLIRPTED